MPATARIATESRGLPAASPMTRWNCSLQSIWSSNRRGHLRGVAELDQPAHLELVDAGRCERGRGGLEQRPHRVEVEQVDLHQPQRLELLRDHAFNATRNQHLR
jgi:hypothetical protein